MAEEQTTQLLSFDIGSRTFAHKHLAQGLDRSFPVSLSSIREYLDPIFEANRCTQYVDDIGVVAHTPRELILNRELMFQCIDWDGLKLSEDECSFGQSKI